LIAESRANFINLLNFETMIVANLKHMRTEHKNITQQELSDIIAVSRSRYASYESGRIEVPIDVLIRLSRFYNVTIDVMLKVDMSKIDLDQLMKLDNNRILLPLKMDLSGNDNYIELIPERISAGYLQGYADAEYIENLSTFSLPFLPVGKHRAFQIEGDSMLPVKSGSYVIGKYIEQISQIKDGRTYVVLTQRDGCTYKRLTKNDDDKILTLTPDNDAFEEYTLPYREILEIWEFTCCINTQEYSPEEINMGSMMNMLRGLRVDFEMIKNGAAKA
jgi:transcriptional regulator with XRE-family HTH domain